MENIIHEIYSDMFARFTNQQLADYIRRNFGIGSDYSETLFSQSKWEKYTLSRFQDLDSSIKAQELRKIILKS